MNNEISTININNQVIDYEFRKAKYDSTKNKRIAILGGTFNPPTIAHIKIMLNILEKCNNIDEIWMEPCGDGRPDKYISTSCQMRYDMCHIILNDMVD